MATKVAKQILSLRTFRSNNWRSAGTIRGGSGKVWSIESKEKVHMECSPILTSIYSF